MNESRLLATQRCMDCHDNLLCPNLLSDWLLVVSSGPIMLK